MARPAKMTICLLCSFLLHAISARALFKSVCKPLIGGGKGLRLKAFCLLEGNDAIRVIDQITQVFCAEASVFIFSLRYT